MKNIKFKVFLVLLLTFISLFVILRAGKSTNSAVISSTKAPVKTILNASKDQLQQYYSVYRDPYIIYLRKALNAYLAHDSSGVDISMAAVQTSTISGFLSGLDSFSKDYYKSKFVVMTFRDSVAGGKDIQIMFQDKPDKIFYAWVYKLSTGTYELRGFNVNENFSQKDIKSVVDYYKPLFFDKNYSL